MRLRQATYDSQKGISFFHGRRHKFSFIFVPVVILFLFLIVGVFGSWLTPYSAADTDLTARLQPGFWEGNWSHPLGTDTLGRDVLTRILAGGRMTLAFSLLSMFFAGSVGTLLGLIAGYFGSWVDLVIMRIVDMALSVPFILLAMVLTLAMGVGFVNLVIVISLLLWAGYARQVRAETLSIKERDYVAFARIAGVSNRRIIATHIFPNLVHVVIVLTTLQVGHVILMESALSFLGVGIPPPTPVWGQMVAEGRQVLNTAWWVALFPGSAIAIVVLSLNLVGDWLRDRLDPKLERV